VTPNCLHIPVSSSAGDGVRWSLCAVGDVCALNDESEPRAITERFGPDLMSLIRRSELSIVNLEAPTCRCDKRIPKSGPAMRMDESVPAGLKQIGFDVATLATNHTMDFGRDGLAETLSQCRKAGLLTCGAGVTRKEALEGLTFEPVKGLRVCVLAFCEQEFGIALDGAPGTAWLSAPDAPREIARAKQASDVVIVVAHGGVEIVPLPPPQRCEQLRGLIDAGATLVIGHHPHVPHGWERYHDGTILYSLGNCLFDYPDGEKLPKTDWGLAVTATFHGATLSELTLALTEQRAGTVDLMRHMDGHWEYLKRLSEVTAHPEQLNAYWQELALQLFADRYLPYLNHALGTVNSELGIRADAKRLLRSVGRRLGLIKRVRPPQEPARFRDPRLLLNMVRNESHRWTIVTALELLGGDVVDRRTPEIQAEVRDLLKWTLE